MASRHNGPNLIPTSSLSYHQSKMFKRPAFTSSDQWAIKSANCPKGLCIGKWSHNPMKAGNPQNINMECDQRRMLIRADSTEQGGQPRMPNDRWPFWVAFAAQILNLIRPRRPSSSNLETRICLGQSARLSSAGTLRNKTNHTKDNKHDYSK